MSERIKKIHQHALNYLTKLVTPTAILVCILSISHSANAEYDRLNALFDEAKERAEREELLTTEREVQNRTKVRIRNYDGPLSQVSFGANFVRYSFSASKVVPIAELIDAGRAELLGVGGDLDRAAHYLLAAHLRYQLSDAIPTDEFRSLLYRSLVSLAQEYENGVNRERDLYASYILYRDVSLIAPSQKVYLKIDEFHDRDDGIAWWYQGTVSNKEMRKIVLDRASCNSEHRKDAFIEYSADLCDEAELRKASLSRQDSTQESVRNEQNRARVEELLREDLKTQEGERTLNETKTDYLKLLAKYREEKNKSSDKATVLRFALREVDEIEAIIAKNGYQILCETYKCVDEGSVLYVYSPTELFKRSKRGEILYLSDEFKGAMQ